MEVRQLKIFAKAAETLNFSEASKQLYITQSTLTQTIKQLEEELGVKLFDRNSHEVYLTEAGSELLAHVDSVINEIEECKARILDLSNLRRGKLSIGVTHSFAMLNTEVVAEFCEQYPKIKIEIVYKCMGELLLMLQRHELDYVLSYKPSYEMPQIDSEVLFHDRLGVIVRRDHPLAERKSVSIRELDQYGLVLPAKGMQTRNVLDRILDKQRTAQDAGRDEQRHDDDAPGAWQQNADIRLMYLDRQLPRPGSCSVGRRRQRDDRLFPYAEGNLPQAGGRGDARHHQTLHLLLRAGIGIARFLPPDLFEG